MTSNIRRRRWNLKSRPRYAHETQYIYFFNLLKKIYNSSLIWDASSHAVFRAAFGLPKRCLALLTSAKTGSDEGLLPVTTSASHF